MKSEILVLEKKLEYIPARNFISCSLLKKSESCQMSTSLSEIETRNLPLFPAVLPFLNLNYHRRKHWILAKISSPIKSSLEIDVCFESPIHCFSKIDEIEMPLEVKLHRGGIKTLYELKGINSQSFCGSDSNRHRFNLHFYTKSFSACPPNKKAKPKTKILQT